MAATQRVGVRTRPDLRRLRPLAVGLCFAWVVIAGMILSLLDLTSSGHAAAYAVVVGAPTLAGALLAWRASTWSQGERATFWRLLAAGFGLFLAAHLLQGSVTLAGFESLGAVLLGIVYVIALTTLFVALTKRLNLVASNTWHVQVLDGATVALAIWSILFALLADRIVESNDIAVWLQIVQPILIMWLFVGAVSAVMTPIPIAVKGAEIVIFMALFIGGVQSWFELYLLIETGSVLDAASGVLFTAALAIAAMAPIFETYDDTPRVRRDDYEPRVWPQFVIGLMPCAALLAILWAGSAAQAVIIVGMTGVFVLAVLRQLEVLRTQRRMYNREVRLTSEIERDAAAARSLARAARDLAATTDRADSIRAVLQAGQSATGAETLRILPGGDRSLVAPEDPGPDAERAGGTGPHGNGRSRGWIGDLAAIRPLSGSDTTDAFLRAEGDGWVPTSSEQRVLEGLTRLLGIALERASLVESMSLTERRLRNLIEALPAAVVEVDGTGRLLSWNPAFEDLTDLTGDEISARRSTAAQGLGQRDLAKIAAATEVDPPGRSTRTSGAPTTRIAEGELSINTVTGTRRRLFYAARLIVASPQTRPTYLVVFWDETKRFEQQKRIVRLVQQLESKKQSRSELLAQVIASTEDERRRLAAELHDGPVQALTALGLRLDSVRVQMEGSPQPIETAQGRLGEARIELGRLVETLRAASSELRPPALDAKGVGVALEQLCRRVEAEHRVRCISDVAGAPTLHDHVSDAAQTVVYRVGQEALTNVVRHANATEVRVFCDVRGDRLRLVVADNGDGTGSFDGASIAELCARGHFGIASMAERVEVLGGEFNIESASRTGQASGTRVSVSVPLRGSPRVHAIKQVPVP